MSTRKRIENITAGVIIEGIPDTCTTIRNLLSAGFATSTTVKTDFEGKSVIKKEQAQLLESTATENNLWVTDLPCEDRFLTRGGEARVYLDNDGKTWSKLMTLSIMLHGWNFLTAFSYTT
jgi:hypothetical protein